MKYELCKDVMIDDAKRASFNELAKKTFGLSFEKWYQDGDWNETNRPYTLFDGDKAVSNISINTMKVSFGGTIRKYIQLGTVMTDRDYRHQGLARTIMDEIMKDVKDECDAMFLFANKSVLEFYPKFGFVKEQQYEYSLKLGEAKGTARKLDMESLEDKEILKRLYSKTNPFSALQAVDGYGLLMFYCGSFMKDCVYYVEEMDAVVIAEQEEEELICYDVYCEAGKDLVEILRAVASETTKKVVFKFAPNNGLDYEVEAISDEDDTLFVLKGKEDIFAEHKLMFPEISHT